MTGTQTFTLEIQASTETAVDWQFHRAQYFMGPELDLPREQNGVRNDHFLKSNTGVVTELVSADNPPQEEFPTESYNSALSFQNSAGGAFQDSSSGHFFGSSDRDGTNCYYALKVLDSDDIETGRDSVINPVLCHHINDPLW